MTEARLQARLDALIYIETDILPRYGARARAVLMDYMWEYLYDNTRNLRALIESCATSAMFDAEACRFTSRLELGYNDYLATFEDDELLPMRYSIGEFPTGETEHLLHLRSYERIARLPQELVGGIVGYLAGDIREFYENLCSINGSYDNDDIRCGLEDEGYGDIDSVKIADVMEERLSTYIMIYSALVATLPPPFA